MEFVCSQEIGFIFVWEAVMDVMTGRLVELIGLCSVRMREVT